MARSAKLEELLEIAAEREAASDELARESAVIRAVVAVAAAIRQRRIDLGWNQQQLADAMGTTQPVVARLENPGADRIPNLATVVKAAHALGQEFGVIDAARTAEQMADDAMLPARDAWHHYRDAHPNVLGAVVVAQVDAERLVLPQNIAVDRDVDAPMIEVDLDD